MILDNPAWNALTTVHACFAEGAAHAKRYNAAIVSFIACEDPYSQQMHTLDAWIAPGESFYIIGHLPSLPAGWQVASELPCAQMLLPSGALPEIAIREKIELLGEEDAQEMYDLINRIQPGYYNMNTRLMGTYYGIRQEGRLVAMAGERMRMTGYSELSAICTDPAFTGRGYAQQLITQLCRQHAAAGITSFLHVAATNERAVRLYEHMGFQTSTLISFYRVVKGV
ncbi:GNAT family N-acetyltransferase [Chitinophaga vietnamensis]|uniref:GNAT family N-acetyltransferase n=1 Tax=Chitinophaga vietnamensis TaxID=2593957 RepID=UPI0011783989|nr:GNAT family N-acetyltransferase [Chitinophaga vietnamensis]